MGAILIQPAGWGRPAGMPKPYSRDLRERVIDAVKKGAMSSSAAARRYEISEVGSGGMAGASGTGWLARAGRAWGSSTIQADAASRVSGGGAEREVGHHASGALRSPFVRARGQGRHFDDEPLLRQDRREAQKKTLVAREQDRRT